jgi:hypothetical protein
MTNSIQISSENLLDPVSKILLLFQLAKSIVFPGENSLYNWMQTIWKDWSVIQNF